MYKLKNTSLLWRREASQTDRLWSELCWRGSWTWWFINDVFGSVCAAFGSDSDQVTGPAGRLQQPFSLTGSVILSLWMPSVKCLSDISIILITAICVLIHLLIRHAPHPLVSVHWLSFLHLLNPAALKVRQTHEVIWTVFIKQPLNTQRKPAFTQNQTGFSISHVDRRNQTADPPTGGLHPAVVQDDMNISHNADPVQCDCDFYSYHHSALPNILKTLTIQLKLH